MQLPLTKKLLTVLTLTIVMVMAPFIALQYEHLKSELLESIDQEAKQTAARVAEAIKPSVWNEYIRPEQVTFSAQVTSAILKAEVSSDRIVGIAIKDPFDQQFLGFYKLEDDTIIELRSPKVMPSPQAIYNEKRYVYPVMSDGTRVAEIDLIYRRGDIKAALTQALSIELIQLTIISLVIIALLYASLRQALLKPIQSLHVAQRAIDSMSEAVVVTDENYRITSVNTAYEEISGETEEALVRRRPEFYVRINGKLLPLWRMVGSLNDWTGEVSMKTLEGGEVPAWLRFNEVVHSNRTVSYVGVVTDITDKKEAEHQLHKMAYFDALTSLPNRTYFMETLNHEIEDSKRHSKRLGLLFIDLDNFKQINDSHGHGAGDIFLKSIANRFRERIRKSDYLFRLSGDEFTAITTDVGNEQHLEVLANDLIQIATVEVELQGGEKISAGASIGVAIYPRDGDNPELLIQHADAAMYEAKETGKNHACFFSKELEMERKSNRDIQTELTHAIEENQLTMYYQPKIYHSVDDNEQVQAEIQGVEALIRWQHPAKGLLTPNHFIHIAEQSDQIIDIGTWVLTAACKQLAIWQQSEMSSLSIAVNLSPRQLRQAGLVTELSELIRRYSINPAKLELELTENAIIENIDHSLVTLNQLKKLGVTLAMDDFGTGYSSLSYLKLLPIDVIKIDRSFIAGLPFDEDDSTIVRAIFSMAKAMKLKVVAEGIENHLQEKYLLREGCKYSQGFLYSKPLSCSELEDWTKDFANRDRPGSASSKSQGYLF